MHTVLSSGAAVAVWLLTTTYLVGWQGLGRHLRRNWFSTLCVSVWMLYPVIHPLWAPAVEDLPTELARVVFWSEHFFVFYNISMYPGMILWACLSTYESVVGRLRFAGCYFAGVAVAVASEAIAQGLKLPWMSSSFYGGHPPVCGLITLTLAIVLGQRVSQRSQTLLVILCATTATVEVAYLPSLVKIPDFLALACATALGGLLGKRMSRRQAR